VERRNGSLDVEVSDDGVGGADPNAGSGLEGLRDRISAIDGWLAIDSLPRKGTVVRASLPVTELGAVSS
jgi:signal transduction histidine kinase